MTTSYPQITSPRSRLTLLATVLISILGLSQNAPAVSVRFLPLNAEVAERRVGVRDDKGVTELDDLNARKRSRAYKCEVAGNSLTLEALDRERPNGRAASVELILDPEMKSPLVLIFPDEETPVGIRVVAVDDGDEGFPWGSVRFVNTTDGPLMVRYDKETMEVPASCAFADIVPGGEARNMGIQLFSDAEPDDVLYSAVWEHDPNLRKLVFITPPDNPDSKRLILSIIPEDKRAMK